jgi:hypothetical protein
MNLAMRGVILDRQDSGKKTDSEWPLRIGSRLSPNDLFETLECLGSQWRAMTKRPRAFGYGDSTSDSTLRRIGSAHPYMSIRQSHSIGPNRNRRSQTVLNIA